MHGDGLLAPRPVANPVIKRILCNYGERKQQRIRDRRYNQHKHSQEIQPEQMENESEDNLTDIPCDLFLTETYSSIVK